MASIISFGLNDITESIPGRGQRRDAIANRELILQVADKLFAERGVSQVCMSEIAQVAGVGKGTLYRHFANKGELCLTLMDNQLRDFQDRMLARMKVMTTQQKGRLGQLTEFLDSLVQFNLIHMPLLQEVQQHDLNISAEDMSRPHYWEYLTVYGLLEGAMRQGEIPAGMDIPVLAEMLLAPLIPFTFRYQLEVAGFTPERISAALRTIVAGLPYVGVG